MNKYVILLLLAVSFSCNRTETTMKTIKRILPKMPTAKVYEYAPMSIPDFFTTLINNHQQDYLHFAEADYVAVCKQLASTVLP